MLTKRLFFWFNLINLSKIIFYIYKDVLRRSVLNKCLKYSCQLFISCFCNIYKNGVITLFRTHKNSINITSLYFLRKSFAQFIIKPSYSRVFSNNIPCKHKFFISLFIHLSSSSFLFYSCHKHLREIL